MADPLSTIIECVNPDLKPEIAIEAFGGFKIIINGFFGVLPNLFKPDLVAKFAADIQFNPANIPSVFIELLFESFGPNLPSFQLKIPELNIDLSYSGIDIPGFDPSGIINLILGIVKMAISIPELFFDFDKKIPKVPSIGDITLGIEMPDFSSIPGFEDFAVRFPKCVLKAVTGVLLP